MATKMQDDAQTEAAKKAIEVDKKRSDLSKAQFAEKTKGKPTPTQEENDLAMYGAHILEHEYDGSDLEAPLQDKHLEAAKPQSYQTRQTHSGRHSE